VGGLCLGNLEVVDHQRLSGAGYCFSASAPPFVSAVAEAALGLLQAEPQLLVNLRLNTASLVRSVSVQCSAFLVVVSHPASPVVHATLTPQAAAKVIAQAAAQAADGAILDADAQWAALAEALAAVCARCVSVGQVALSSTKRMKGEVTGYHALASQQKGTSAAAAGPPQPLPPPTLRLAVRATLDEKQLRTAATALQQACAAVLK
jgi:serine palmitoyltransferase